MRLRVRKPAWTTSLGLGLLSVLAVCGALSDAHSEGVGDLAFVMPGMNQTELQSVLGPPDYIQVKGLRQAWQYCPRRLLRYVDQIFRSDHAPYVTVWFNDGRVEHMRAYPSRMMGQCEDFLAAFRWEDQIGPIGGYGAYDEYGMK